jgi:hypothetical protein
MKDHVKEERYVNLDGSVDDVIAEIKDKAEGLVNPEIGWEDGWGDINYVVTGWRPMTDEEKEAARKRSERAKKARKAQLEKKREAELKEYERLKKKFGDS